jgi:hypothetical protein
MQFILLLVGDEKADAQLDEAELTALMDAHGAFTERLLEAGAHVFGVALAETATATTIDVAGDGTVTDGPFAETAEQIGGIYVIDVADIDAAIEWARQVPVSAGLRVEVRPGLDV